MSGSHRAAAILHRNALAAILLLGPISDEVLGQSTSPQQHSAAAAQPGEVAPRGARPAKDMSYGEWRKICFRPSGTRALCRTMTSGGFEPGQTVVRIDLIERDGDDTSRLQIILPVGLYLQAGITLTVDKGQPYRLPYTWCLANACVAAGLAEANLVRKMEAGDVLVIEAVDSNLVAVETSIPLRTFFAARTGLPQQSFEQTLDE